MTMASQAARRCTPTFMFRLFAVFLAAAVFVSTVIALTYPGLVVPSVYVQYWNSMRSPFAAHLIEEAPERLGQSTVMTTATVSGQWTRIKTPLNVLRTQGHSPKQNEYNETKIAPVVENKVGQDSSNSSSAKKQQPNSADGSSAKKQQPNSADGSSAKKQQPNSADGSLAKNKQPASTNSSSARSKDPSFAEIVKPLGFPESLSRRLSTGEQKRWRWFGRVLRWDGTPVVRGAPRWQTVDTNFTAFVYSAHWDDVDHPPVVRIVGIAVDVLPFSDVTCRFFSNSSGSGAVHVVLGQLYHFRNRNGRRYIGAYVDCPLPDVPAYVPFAVSVSRVNATFVSNYLVIHYSHSDTWLYNYRQGKVDITRNGTTDINKTRRVDGWRWNITRCFPAFQQGFDQHELLAEMVAASKVLGVQRFVFYVESAGPLVLRMIQVLVDEGLAEVHPWNMHMFGSSLFYVAQFSSIQDCLYRHLWSSKYVLFGDVDELFVPRKGTNLLPLLEKSFAERPSCGTFLFLNTNFNLNIPTHKPPDGADPTDLAHSHKLQMLTHVRRETLVWPSGQRSKPAVDPLRVETGSVHVVQTLREGFQMCTLNKTLGLLHHYRNFPQPPPDLQVEDHYLWKIARNIIDEAKTIFKRFDNVHP